MQPPTKKRKTEKTGGPVVEEINFDTAARQEYLTGFHKRKLQRAKHAQEAAEKKARADRIVDRKKLRDDRKADLERQVEEFNALLKPIVHTDSENEDEDEEEKVTWEGIGEPDEVDHEAEYVDEDRYTTVTIEAMDVSKEGLHKAEGVQKPPDKAKEELPEAAEAVTAEDRTNGKRKWTKEKPKDKANHVKKKPKKFRYETKTERKFTRVKQKMKNSKQASARREG